ncbi:MAG: NAD(+)/NADH kinase [Candidatus Desulfofervidaceae bacterium]|nr:NAD(+)/NADH kinase [Candidatus Desulfofervidaceae bacterium]
MAKMRRVGIYFRHDTETQKKVQELISWLEEKGYKVFLPPLPDNFDLMIVLGGDGSLLRAARVVWPREIPILGINCGELGFLATVNKDESYEMITKVLKGEFEVEKRMVLEGTLIKKDKEQGPFMALNEVAIERGAYTHLISLALYVGNLSVTSLRADGIIVATPTGSTAYSLSAGGPIVHPALDALIVTSICPFHLVHRSLVLPPECLVGVVVEKGGEGVRIVLDGQVFIPLEVGDRVEIKKSQYPIYLIKNGKYFQTLNQKLCWGC